MNAAAAPTKSGSPRRSQKLIHGSTTEHVAEELRRLIQIGEYSPGEQLRQVEIAERIEVSRIPVREALMTLTASGVVEHRLNRGYFVPKITQEEMRQLYIMRGLLEAELIRHIRWPEEGEVAELVALNEQIADAISRQEADRLVRLNREFHFTIFRWCDQRMIETEIKRIWDISEGTRRSLISSTETRAQVIEEHKVIIEAIRQHDFRALAVAMNDHRLSGWKKLTGSSESYEVNVPEVRQKG